MAAKTFCPSGRRPPRLRRSDNMPLSEQLRLRLAKHREREREEWSALPLAHGRFFPSPFPESFISLTTSDRQRDRPTDRPTPKRIMKKLLIISMRASAVFRRRRNPVMSLTSHSHRRGREAAGESAHQAFCYAFKFCELCFSGGGRESETTMAAATPLCEIDFYPLS